MNIDPWARLMTPMTPKIKVSPLAIKNSNRPYCGPVSSCASSPGTSIPISRRQRHTSDRSAVARTGGISPGSHQFAAGARIAQIFGGNAHHFVFATLRPAQVDVLGDVLRRRHADRPARAVDFGLAHGLVEIGLVLDAALDGFEAQRQQLCGVVALNGIDVGLAPGLVLEGL